MKIIMCVCVCIAAAIPSVSSAQGATGTATVTKTVETLPAPPGAQPIVHRAPAHTTTTLAPPPGAVAPKPAAGAASSASNRTPTNVPTTPVHKAPDVKPVSVSQPAQVAPHVTAPTRTKQVPAKPPQP